MRVRGTIFAFLLLFYIGIASAQQDITALLEEVIDDFAPEDGPALVVQLTTPDGSWTAATGLADGSRPTVAEDRFRIGSMSKTFVAVSALMLVDEGLFELDDLASQWLPEEALARVANTQTVTLRQLLGMRSGIADYLGTNEFWNAVLTDPSRTWTALDVLEYTYDLPAEAAVDEVFSYSNSNYILLQLILEEASGMPLHELVRSRILDPLEMKDTYTQVSEELPGGFVNGYGDLNSDGELEDLTHVNDGAGLGDGALISTTGDLTRFYQALFQEQSLLSEAMMDELLNFQADDAGGYSLGVTLWKTPVEAWGHSGGVLGFLSIGAYVPDAETIIIVLSASEQFSPEELALAILEAASESVE